MDVRLLHYRAWRGRFRRPLAGVWPVARVALGTLLRRKLFWFLYATGLLVFLLFFFGTALFNWAETQLNSTQMTSRSAASRPSPSASSAHSARACASSTAPAKPTWRSSTTSAASSSWC